MRERRRDEARTAALLAAAAPGTGSQPPAVRVRGFPSPPVRFAQRVWAKLGRLDYERAVADPLATALGPRGAGPPRFLVRVDEFPHYLAWDEPERYGTAAFMRFHETMRAAGVPYLLAALPRLSRAPLDPGESRWRALADDERALLAYLERDGVTLALHGLDHRTRFASPRRHSEFCGLDATATRTRLDEGMAELAAGGVSPRVFVPPFNRFDARQYGELARRFDVVCGGPESIALVGFQRPPQWRGEAVYLPSYAPMYGHAAEVAPAAARLAQRSAAQWMPIVLHWGWEAADGYAELSRMLAQIAPYTAHWDEFLAAVRESEQAAP